MYLPPTPPLPLNKSTKKNPNTKQKKHVEMQGDERNFSNQLSPDSVS